MFSFTESITSFLAFLLSTSLVVPSPASFSRLAQTISTPYLPLSRSPSRPSCSVHIISKFLILFILVTSIENRSILKSAIFYLPVVGFVNVTESRIDLTTFLYVDFCFSLSFFYRKSLVSTFSTHSIVSVLSSSCLYQTLHYLE